MSGVLSGVPQPRSPASLPGDGTEAEQHNEVLSLHNALTGDDTMVAKRGLQIVVGCLVFLSPASTGYRFLPTTEKLLLVIK